ncbi:BON domain-containing protein [Rhizobium sp. FKY42]|uniref:BON domain-containing protein n=1 Tax=Rhizobium sp. FKY42 TaxID=2562310 RepID=UPI0010C0766A|nr:BON domain-containing protein [Rhizobium sp. FKY42]
MFLSSSLSVPSFFSTSCWKLHSLAAELRYALSGQFDEVTITQDGRHIVLTGYVASEELRGEVCRLAHELASGVPVLCMLAVLTEINMMSL